MNLNKTENSFINRLTSNVRIIAVYQKHKVERELVYTKFTDD